MSSGGEVCNEASVAGSGAVFKCVLASYHPADHESKERVRWSRQQPAVGGSGSTVDVVRDPLDREGGVLTIDHDPRDCALPCPVHDAKAAPLLRAAFHLRADLEAAQAEVERYEKWVVEHGMTLAYIDRVILPELHQARARIAELEAQRARLEAQERSESTWSAGKVSEGIPHTDASAGSDNAISGHTHGVEAFNNDPS